MSLVARELVVAEVGKSISSNFNKKEEIDAYARSRFDHFYSIDLLNCFLTLPCSVAPVLVS